MLSLRVLFILLSSAGLAGCINSQQTRLPTINNAPLAQERLSQGRFDPFPNRTLGPDTQVRPRSFRQERTEERQGELRKMYLDIERRPAIGSTNTDYPEVVPQ